MIETTTDLVSILVTAIGDAPDEAFLEEFEEEEFRLNGGVYGQVGKGFHKKPYIPIQNVASDAPLNRESKRERRIRLFSKSSNDASAADALFWGKTPDEKRCDIPAMLPMQPAFVSSPEEALQLPEQQLKILRTTTGAAICL